MSLPCINFLHLTLSEIQPGQTFSRRPPAHPDTMSENNTLTALKGCGVKTSTTHFSTRYCVLTQRIPDRTWLICLFGVLRRDGSVSKMCTSGGRQCKTVPIPELRVLVHPNQTWIFPLNDIAIKVPKWTKYERNLYNFFRFLVCSQYFKFSFHFMCCQARFRL